MIDKETILKASTTGDGAALARIHEHLKQYSAGLAKNKKQHLDIEANDVVIKGMDYRMSREQMQTWNMLITEMAKQIQEEEN